MKISKHKKILFISAIFIAIIALSGFIVAKMKDAVETFAAGSYPAYNMSSWLFFDPVNPNSTCNETNYWTLYDQDTTCYRWFLAELGDNSSKSTIRLILDHSVDRTNYSGIEAVLNNTRAAWNNYNGNIDILTEDEIASIMKLSSGPVLDGDPNHISVSGIDVNYNFTTNSIYDIDGQRYDNSGFWSSTLYPDNTDYAYTITEFGNNRLVETSKIRGVRPVIEIAKDRLTSAPVATNLTSLLQNSSPLKYPYAYSHGYTYRQMQGFTLTANNLVFYSSNAGNTSNGLVFGYTGNNFASAVSGTPYYAEGGGHGNDMTYNPNTNKVILTALSDLWVLNGNSLAYEDSIDVGSDSKMGFTFGQIGYDETDNKYIAGSKKTAYITNENFEGIQYSITMPHNEYTQGLEYHNGYIYQTGWKPTNCAEGVLYCDNLPEGSGIVNVYNAKFNSDGTPSKDFGRRVKEIYIDGTANLGELESISFHNNEAYLGFTNYRPYNECIDTNNSGDELCYVFYHFPYSNIAVNPQASVAYSDSSSSFTVTISSSDQLQPTNGYTQSSDGYSITKTVYAESISETVNVCDRYSNCSTVNVAHNNSSHEQAQTVTFANGSVSKVYGDASFINAASTNGDGNILYSSDNPAVATVNPSTGEVTIVGAGTANITATASQTDSYGEGMSSYTLTVAKATSTRPSELNGTIAGVVGETLSAITFATEGISWVDGDTLILFGENEYQVKYTQDNDASNYSTETFTVAVRGTVHVYLVIEGNNQIYVKGESEVASFRIDVDFSLFEEYGKVYIDGQQLSSGSYRAESGSTIISLKKAYVDSLDAGTHDFTVAFGDFGMATAKFEIANAQDDPDPDQPDDPVQPDDATNQGDTDVIVPNTSNDVSSEKSSKQKDDDNGGDTNDNAGDVFVPDTGNNTKENNNITVEALCVSIFLLPMVLLFVYRASRRRIRHRKF